MRLEVRHLEVLVVLADARSVSAAAARLGIAQPTLTGQLQRIERALQVRLFTRDARGAVPTPAGEDLVAQARPIVAAMAALDARARHLARPVDDIRMGGNANQVFAAFLVTATQGFGRPVRGHVDMSSRVLTDLLSDGELDLVVVGVHVGFDEAAPSRMRQATYVEEVPFVVVMTEDHARAHQLDVSLQELREEHWLLPAGVADGTLSAVHAAFGSAGFVPRAPLGRVQLANFPTSLASGRAVGLTVPTATPIAGTTTVPLRDKVVRGRLVLRWNPETVTESEAEWCRRELLREYVEHVRRGCEELPWWDAAPQYRPRLAVELAEELGLSW